MEIRKKKAHSRAVLSIIIEQTWNSFDGEYSLVNSQCLKEFMLLEKPQEEQQNTNSDFLLLIP